MELEERAQVEGAARDQSLIEGLRARRVAGARAQEAAVTRVQRIERIVETARRRRLASPVLARDDRELDREHLLRRELALDPHARSLGDLRRGVQRDLRRAPHTVASDALEQQALRAAFHGRARRPAVDLAVAAYREHVAERCLELELDDQMDRPGVRVQHADALPQAVGEEARSADRERVRGVARRAEGGATLRVHQLERRHVVLLGVRRQQHGLGAVDAEPVAREELRVVVVEPERARRRERQASVVLGDEDELILFERYGHALVHSLALATCSSFSFSIASAPNSTMSSDCAVVMFFASSTNSATRR